MGGGGAAFNMNGGGGRPPPKAMLDPPLLVSIKRIKKRGGGGGGGGGGKARDLTIFHMQILHFIGRHVCMHAWISMIVSSGRRFRSTSGSLSTCISALTTRVRARRLVL